jgi:hypothetical protein
MKTFLSACLASAVSPLLTAIYAWLALHLGPEHAELARWLQFGDLWQLFIGEFVVVFVLIWSVGCPIFLIARSRRAVSAPGLCMAGIATGAAIFFLVAIVFSSALTALVAAAVGAAKGLAVAAVFCALAGIPRVPGVVRRSILLQRDVVK